jgi:hypothetical protein
MFGAACCYTYRGFASIAGSAVAKHGGRSALCRPHWLARREREEMPGESAGPFGNARVNWRGGCSCSRRNSALGAMASSPHREHPRHSQDHDRGLGAQASDRPVAARSGARCTGRRRFASGTMNGGC